MMAGEKFLSNNDSTEERKWGKRETDARARKILRQVGTDARPKGRPGLHDESDHNVDVPVHRVPNRAVTG
jgi:hypothetical protein